MYFKDKGNTDIDEDLKYTDEGTNKIIVKIRKNIPYVIFGALFLIGILLIYIGSKM